MARLFNDRVLATTTTTGTGNITLAGAVTGFAAFAASTGDIFDYAIFAVDGSGVPTGDWETGVGTFTDAGTTFSRAVSKSSNANAAVNFAAGTKHVALTLIGATISDIVTRGLGSYFNGACFSSITIASSHNTATLGTSFTPSRDMVVDALNVIIDAGSAGHSFYTQISTVTLATGVIGTILGTSASVSARSADPEVYTFEYATPLELSEGIDYMFSVTYDQASGTAPVRAGYVTTAYSYNAPTDVPINLSRYYNTVGLSASQAPSASTGASNVFLLWPRGFLA